MWYHFRWGLSWTFFVFLLCALPGKAIPSSRWFDLISLDKVVHASIFWVHSVLWIHAIKNCCRFPVYHTWVLVLGIFISIAYGGFLELLQSSVFMERTGDWNDFIANSVGASIAYFFHQPRLGYSLGILK